MEEVLRIVHGKQDKTSGYRLQDYNLEVYGGEIVYIQGLSGSGILGLAELLSGNRPLTEGAMFIDEKPISDYTKEKADAYHIYTISRGKNLVETMTVAENLELIRTQPSVFRFFDHRNVERKVTEFLQEKAIFIRADLKMDDITMEERIKLSLLKAEMHGARVIVIEAVRVDYGGKMAEELCKMILSMKEKGMTFLILADKYSPFAEIADRIQVMRQGCDWMEWREMNEEVRSIIRADKYREKKGKRHFEERVAGLYDYEWPLSENIWSYLLSIYRDNTQLFETCLFPGIVVPGQCYDGVHAVVTRESADCLLTKLSINDNIIMTVPKRVSHSKYGVIRSRLKENITREYYRLANVDPAISEIGRLNRVQRKILSIYRWEIAKPKIIFLENPCWGMDAEEMAILETYLDHLTEKGIRLACISKSLDELRFYCGKILVSHNGKRLEVLSEQNKKLH